MASSSGELGAQQSPGTIRPVQLEFKMKRLVKMSLFIRGVFAVFAVFTTLVLAAVIDGLSSEPYTSERAQLVLERTAVARFL
jgi:hypothetical protein